MFAFLCGLGAKAMDRHHKLAMVGLFEKIHFFHRAEAVYQYLMILVTLLPNESDSKVLIKRKIYMYIYIFRAFLQVVIGLSQSIFGKFMYSKSFI